TSSGCRVRRDGTMPISSSAYARRPVLPRPISTCVMSGPPSHVVRRLADHLYVVRMALGQPGRGDLGEPRLLQVGDGGRAAVAHGGPQAAGELVGDGGQRPPERHLGLDALGYQLV